MDIIKLSGHSGCRLMLENVGNKFTVKKSAKDSQYNERLLKQAEKQRGFTSEYLYTPKIIIDGYDNQGIYFFKMEYINGSTLADAFKTTSLDDIDKYVDIFMNIVPKNLISDSKAKGIFGIKIDNLKESIKINNEDIELSYQLLTDFDWRYITKSYCHGDLTLENILISDDKLYLIDFLDSFYNSWLIDFAKLFQDLEIFWSYRNDRNFDVNLKLRLLVLKDRLLQQLMGLDNGKNYIESIYYILLLNVLRIMPYANDEQTINWLIKKLHHLNKRIIKKEYI